MNKIEVKVNYDKEFFKFLIKKDSNIYKLSKILEAYLDSLDKYEISLLGKNLSRFDKMLQLDEILIEEKVLEITVKNKKGHQLNYDVECLLSNQLKTFSISSYLKFHDLKYNVLVNYPQLDDGDFMIIYKDRDMSNVYRDDTLLCEIFRDEVNVQLELKVFPKKILEYHKRCSYCLERKGVYICIKCTLAFCNNCQGRDIHINNKTRDFVMIPDFPKYEQSSLTSILNKIQENVILNEKLPSKNFTQYSDYKTQVIKSKFDHITQLLNELKNIQIDSLTNTSRNIIDKYQPESISTKLNSMKQDIMLYKSNTYPDCEESMSKILEYTRLTELFNTDFEKYKENLSQYNQVFNNYDKICSDIENYLNESLQRVRYVPALHKSVKYNKILKVLDNSSVLVYDHEMRKFSVLKFLDVEGKFKENFNNFVQLNWKGEKIFIITGSLCNMLFIYNLKTNQMEFISTLLYSHNWWPVILMIEELEEGKQLNLRLYCLSGSYSKKCEELIYNQEANKDTLNWKEIGDTLVSHGQATGYVQNNQDVYLLFGYDYNFKAISIIERMRINENKWEAIMFKNPDHISSFLYYHSNLKVNDNELLIIGGLKEIDEVDYVYKLDLKENLTLTKTSNRIEFTEVKFSNEKSFLCLSKEDYLYGLIDANNNVHLIKTRDFSYECVTYTY